MENIIIIAILVAVIGGAIWYIVKEKKKGTVCIGCPNSGSCSSKASGCCGGCGDARKNANLH